jgi:hypothetical protein
MIPTILERFLGQVSRRKLTAGGLLGSAALVSPEAKDPGGPTLSQLLLGLALIAGIAAILVTQC